MQLALARVALAGALLVGVAAAATNELMSGASGGRFAGGQPPATAHPGGGRPFLRAYPPPSTPPEVRLVLGSGDWEQQIPGKLYTAHWPVRAGSLEVEPATLWPWPKSSKASSASRNLALSLPAPTPDWIEVKGFGTVNAKTGEPSGEPGHVWECNPFGTASPCTFSHSQAYEILELESEFLRYGYLIVFASWFVPFDSQALGPDARPRVTASWLFRREPA